MICHQLPQPHPITHQGLVQKESFFFIRFLTSCLDTIGFSWVGAVSETGGYSALVSRLRRGEESALEGRESGGGVEAGVRVRWGPGFDGGGRGGGVGGCVLKGRLVDEEHVGEGTGCEEGGVGPARP